MNSIKVYDISLLNFEEKCWSPNTFKTRGIPFDSVWVSFEEIPIVIPKLTKTTETPTVPVIVDTSKDVVIQDSWKIAQYLEANYPDTPSLFHGNEELHEAAQASFSSFSFALFRLVIMTVANNIGNEDVKAEFRKSREAKFGMTLEKFAGNPEDQIRIANEGLKDIRAKLAKSTYLSGSEVGWADGVLLAYFVMVDVLKHDIFQSRILDSVQGKNPLREWYERMAKYV
ncbi:hypothetical protein PHYBLDRAFT_141582 [Phycomyces blakesleeanus NRRL 1555(-)]|uniref:Uncharacterized protein n=1 Tax=Phycomyces blakesleeanus (strain ATCC 8743b / DSM 1359 / FGSC 10004 / NBRC 33097 / NRRL 1555) TaxID=763407 RepID=A0A167PDL0_PHYB8|nr:hypothetical protein PHYBLDRAFT_141582 [Phycomyces blakesleeanus NRRL 1555(-)]OAD77718.1 hypothetical protein PHYBLDRAFT_141582 [Phycomyces blakesleeanus NRRL 1555(-)]|eukprot:XP_018295758.1 hypothetical protein PHYBLDRAFT_141582 [Phycomyces blakesleeanus NRRL 1555(-)]